MYAQSCVMACCGHLCAGGAVGLGMCVWMHVCTAISASFFPNSLKYLEALCFQSVT